MNSEDDDESDQPPQGGFMIIALGESLIAAGVATSEVERGVLFAVSTAGAVVAACGLWWLYFRMFHGALENAMSQRGDDTRGQFARDVFSLWHAFWLQRPRWP